MKTSCIIPTRNRCDMVLEAIESAYGQIEPCFEVIVVDDGSVDNTTDVVAGRYPEVKLVRLNGVGPGIARNAGVRASTGDTVMFLDSDDRWCENHSQALNEVLASGYAVAYGITESEDEVCGGTFLIPGEGEAVYGDCYQELLRWCFLVPSAVALKREVFLSIGGFSECDQWQFGEDWDFFLRLAAKHHFGFAGKKIITKRRLHQGSLCNRIDKDAIIGLVGRIQETATNQRGFADDDRKRFKQMEQIIQERGAQWETVQEWYVAMKSEKII